MSRAERRARKRQNKQIAQQQRYAAWRRARRLRWAGRIMAIALIVALVGGVAAAVFGGGDDVAPTPTTESTEATTTTLPEALAAIECSDETPEAADAERPSFDAPPETVIDPAATYRATIETTCGTLVAEIAPSDPEVSVAGANNFVFLARAGFYDGLTFHRVIPDFVIQGGDPTGDGTGGPGYQFGSADEIPDDLSYEVGDLVYANSGAPETSGSQIFVVTGPQGEQLPPNFIKFGRLVDGIDVAQRVSYLIDLGQATDQQAPPSQPVYVVSVTVEET